MADFILYGTDGCHLCEEAEQLLLQGGLSFEIRDIIDDEQAEHRYAVRIPVLLHQLSGLELGWPFDDKQIRDFIALT
jgi:hypothetical protein